MRTSYTAVVERDVFVTGAFAAEGYECGWASEAIFFVRVLAGELSGVTARVEISPDGMRWCAEGSTLVMPGADGLAFVRVGHFGNWLRLALDAGGKSGKIILTLHLKE
jgi:hypothetical protein